MHGKPNLRSLTANRPLMVVSMTLLAALAACQESTDVDAS